MIWRGICPIFIFAQAIKQQYLRQFEGLLSSPILTFYNFHKFSTSEQLAMIWRGICPIFIFAQAIKQQYLRQFEGLLSNPDTDGVLHHSQKKTIFLVSQSEKKNFIFLQLWLRMISFYFLKHFFSDFAAILNDFYIIFYFESVFLLISYFRLDDVFPLQTRLLQG